jgi:prophage regulatory protein
MEGKSMAAQLAKDLARNDTYGISESGAPPVDKVQENNNKEDKEQNESGAPPLDRFLPLAAVIAATGVSRSTIYAMVAADRFPKPVKIGNGKNNGWPASEISKWQRDRMAARDASSR